MSESEVVWGVFCVYFVCIWGVGIVAWLVGCPRVYNKAVSNPWIKLSNPWIK